MAELQETTAEQLRRWETDAPVPLAPVPADASAEMVRRRTRLAPARRLTHAVTVLAVLAVLYTLFVARVFLVPITYAVLLSILFSSVVRAMGRVGIARPLAAAIVVLALVSLLGAAVYGLAGPVQRWADAAPATMGNIQDKIRQVLRPLQRVQRTAQAVAQQTTADPTVKTPPAVVVQGPSLISRFFGTTGRFLTSLLEGLVLLFFLLATGDLFLEKLVKILPNVADKRKAVRIARETETSIAAYLRTVAMVNLTEGIVVAGVMFLLGMPTPALWGALVTLLEFIPYFGAATAVLVLSLAAFSSFDAPGHALLVPASFLLINLVQAYVVTPLVLGFRLSLNPVALFIGLSFWFWIWGVPGAFIAVPLLATFKILCDHVETLKPVGEFLGQRSMTRGRRRGSKDDPVAA